MNDVKDKKILIVGGSSGFGFAAAKSLLEKGAQVVITSRKEEKVDTALKILKEVSSSIEGKVLDVADEEQLKRFFSDDFKVDFLISMAGSFMGGGFLDTSYEVIVAAIQDKLFANLKLARYAQKHLNDNGGMVFTSGSGGRADNASGAIIGNQSISTMAKGLALELSKHRIRVNAVAPTWTKTPLWHHMSEEDVQKTEAYFSSMIPLGRTAQIDEVASAYIFLIENSFINGQTLVIDGGLTLL